VLESRNPAGGGNLSIDSSLIAAAASDTANALSALMLVGRETSADLQYIALLEKTNAQLGLWWNPYGVMVAALGVLFTVLAIFATVLIWRQGSDHKQILLKSIAEYRRVLDTLVKERVDALNQSLVEAIDAEKAKLATVGSEQRKLVESKIKELEAKKNHLDMAEWSYGGSTRANLGPAITGSIPLEMMSSWIDLSKNWEPTIINMDPIHECAKCGHRYNVEQDSGKKLVKGSGKVTCPKCGNVEKRRSW
jgi:DNA-directed RNA polymerase subunit RPC12/RpoP